MPGAGQASENFHLIKTLQLQHMAGVMGAGKTYYGTWKGEQLFAFTCNPGQKLDVSLGLL